MTTSPRPPDPLEGSLGPLGALSAVVAGLVLSTGLIWLQMWAHDNPASPDHIPPASSTASTTPPSTGGDHLNRLPWEHN